MAYMISIAYAHVDHSWQTSFLLVLHGHRFEIKPKVIMAYVILKFSNLLSYHGNGRSMRFTDSL